MHNDSRTGYATVQRENPGTLRNIRYADGCVPDTGNVRAPMEVRKDFVNPTAGMPRFRSFSARELAHLPAFSSSTQLSMRRSEQKSQHWARRN